MEHQADDSLVFSSKKRVFRVLSVDEAGLPQAARPAPRRGERSVRAEQGSAVWLSPAMENAVDAWAAAQPEPKPGRVEAIRRLLDKALGAAP